jgi:hypothetical protein
VFREIATAGEILASRWLFKNRILITCDVGGSPGRWWLVRDNCGDVREFFDRFLGKYSAAESQSAGQNPVK